MTFWIVYKKWLRNIDNRNIPNKTSRSVITEPNTKYKPLFFSDMKQSTSIIDYQPEV